MFIRTTLLSLPILLAVIPAAYADEQDLSKARDALQKQDNDSDTEKDLEQVLDAAVYNYSLFSKDGKSLNYNFDYSYYGAQRIDLIIHPTLDSEGVQSGSYTIIDPDVAPVASHTFT